jgi:hypothetical protein
VLAAGQINAKTHRFIEENGLARRVRFADVREDFHFWLDPELLREALTQIP